MRIIEASELPENEKVYLKKDFMGWRVVEPYKNPDGSYNWFNLLLGGKRNLFILAFLLVICFLLYFGVKEIIANETIVSQNPCAFCKDCQAQCRQVISGLNSYKNTQFNVSLSELIKEEG